MSPRLLLFVAVAAAALGTSSTAVSAQSSPPPPAAPAAGEIDPVGTYDLSVVVQGAAVSSTIRIERKADATFGGTVATQAYGTFQIEAVKVTGKTMTISIYAQDGNPVTISLTLDGDQVTGEWSMASDGSKVTGKKLPPA
jgi:hypothetical protein